MGSFSTIRKLHFVVRRSKLKIWMDSFKRRFGFFRICSGAFYFFTDTPSAAKSACIEKEYCYERPSLLSHIQFMICMCHSTYNFIVRVLSTIYRYLQVSNCSGKAKIFKRENLLRYSFPNFSPGE